MKILNTVKKIREQEGITQEQLAGVLGVSRQTVISIEKGNYTPSLLLALQISEYFKLPIEKIFKLE